MSILTLIAQKDPFGTIEAPAGVADYGAGPDNIGILVFASRLIQIGTVIAGLWVMANFILAGLDYITGGGNSETHSKIATKLTNSILGLVIIVGAYAIAALLGLIFFGKATYFLNPEITGPTSP